MTTDNRDALMRALLERVLDTSGARGRYHSLEYAEAVKAAEDALAQSQPATDGVREGAFFSYGYRDDHGDESDEPRMCHMIDFTDHEGEHDLVGEACSAEWAQRIVAALNATLSGGVTFEQVKSAILDTIVGMRITPDVADDGDRMQAHIFAQAVCGRIGAAAPQPVATPVSDTDEDAKRWNAAWHRFFYPHRTDFRGETVELKTDVLLSLADALRECMSRYGIFDNAYPREAAALRSKASDTTQAGEEGLRSALAEALGSELTSVFDCSRVWEAWSTGTMSQDDFSPVNDRLDEIVDGLLPIFARAVAPLAAALREIERHPQGAIANNGYQSCRQIAAEALRSTALPDTDMREALALMSAAFRTTVSEPRGDGRKRYAMEFEFPDLDTLHAADDEWRAFVERGA